ncbi:MAG: peptide-methionine (S)-S-oxide reductase MsrA [Burkholderiaceae bacterium]|nr:peptide-methionine (S)-S-oxide reductase MsrA [Burkholderiaceae bacterium]
MNEQVAVLGGGCFWCLEACYADVDGVLGVESGYSGGHVDQPDYESVCGGRTGHAEVVRVRFDADLIDFETILGIFFSIHDPTTRDRQGNDVGPQYRSVIFTVDASQREVADAMIERLERERVFDDPIVTEVMPLTNYFPAENYHQRYFEQNPGAGYCRFVVAPKVLKFRREFARRLKR